MSEYSLTPVEQRQIALLHAHLQAGDALEAPFAKEIFLIETHIAGTTHVPIRAIEPTLQPGVALVLRREPDNPHDPLAIPILTESGQKVGYVPRDRNEILARLMDAGKFLFARFESKEWHGDWLRIAARVFLRDV
ncbi:MAG: restriction endonuclease [Verrucomicrobiaceae bacterium]|nr:restriction endonuclease [Verrucomicrobiaceae bacterium]